MNTSNQTQTVKTQTKLSAAQVKMLKWCESGFNNRMLINTDRKMDANRAEKLKTLGLLEVWKGSDLDGPFVIYEITNEGRKAIGIETVEAVIAQSAPVETPVIESDDDKYPELTDDDKREANYQEQLDAVYGGRLVEWPFPEMIPAPVETPVIAETPAAPKMGDTVTGENVRGHLVTGKVTAIGCKVVTGVKYVHVLSGSITHEIAVENVLPSKMPAAPVEAPVMDEDTVPVIHTKHDLYQAMKAAEEVYIRYMRLDTWDLPADHATYQKKVKAHIDYLRAQAAFTGLSNEYLIAYLYGAKNARIQRKEGVSSASTASQVTSIEMDAQPAEIASTRDMGASSDDGFIPASTDAYVHPLRLAQPGSAAYNMPSEQTLKAQRNQQYAEAKARIEAANGVYQAPVRQAIQMHSASDLRAMFAAMDGAS